LPDRELPEPLEIGLRRVSPNYLNILDIPLMAGRSFSDADDAAAPKVAIINRTLAQRVFGEVDPVGRDIALPLGDGDRVRFRVVGVAADIRNAGLRGAPDPEVLIPFKQTPWVGMTFLVLAPNAGDDLMERLQEAIWTHDPQEATTRIYRLEDDVAAESAQLGFFSRMLSGFAVLAALLAAFGTYSVIALLQRQRTAEIGVRLALGAGPAHIARQVISLGAGLALVAGLVGSVVAFAVLRLLGNQLYGIQAAEPGLYAFGLIAVLLTALAASALPAWRAARITPVEALHYE
jgi:ABC-type antimicrobial peptide transport system permease subunit